MIEKEKKKDYSKFYFGIFVGIIGGLIVFWTQLLMPIILDVLNISKEEILWQISLSLILAIIIFILIVFFTEKNK